MKYPGVKIINDDPEARPPKPANRIISTAYPEVMSDGTGSGYLEANPEQVVCGSPFQTHKRYKIGMLPAMVTTTDATRFGAGVNMIFNVTAGAVTRYQVFQKINNWTDSRLDSIKIEIGTGVGSAFLKTSSTAAAGLLTLSVPDKALTDGIWEYDQLANFSAGLFGPPDNNFPASG